MAYIFDRDLIDGDGREPAVVERAEQDLAMLLDPIALAFENRLVILRDRWRLVPQPVFERKPGSIGFRWVRETLAGYNT